MILRKLKPIISFSLTIIFLTPLIMLCGSNIKANAADKNVYMRYPNGCTKAVTLAFDDGLVKDSALIEVFKRNGLKATFYLNTGRFGQGGGIWQYLTERQAIDLYSNSGMEVASHTKTHPDLTKVLSEQGETGLKSEVFDDITKIESMFGTEVYGIAYPGAPPYKLVNDDVITYLKSIGVGYGRMVADTYSFDLPENWHKWYPTHDCRDPEMDSVVTKFVTKNVTKEPLLYFVWGHAYEFYEANTSMTLEQFEQKFCVKVSGKSNIWYATNGEVYTYVKDYEKLQISSSKDSVKNPTSRDLWISFDGKTYKIKAGETVKGIFSGDAVSSKQESSAVSENISSTQSTVTAQKPNKQETTSKNTTTDNTTYITSQVQTVIPQTEKTESSKLTENSASTFVNSEEIEYVIIEEEQKSNKGLYLILLIVFIIIVILVVCGIIFYPQLKSIFKRTL